MSIPSAHPYRLGLVAGALGFEQCRTLAALRIQHGSWTEVRDFALKDNAMRQSRTASLIRVEREYRQRLQTLTEEQLSLLSDAPGDTARLVALLAAFKHYAFPFDLCATVLRQKLQSCDTEFRPSDYETFIATAEVGHPELAELSISTRAKLRQVTFRLLAEAGILSGTRNPRIVRPNLTPAFLSCVLDDRAEYLAGFLVPDSEIRALSLQTRPSAA